MTKVSNVTPIAAPLRAVDEVTVDRLEYGWRIRASKAISVTDPYMEGHFPHATIYPGVFVLESLRQAVSDGLGVSCEVEHVGSARFLLPLVSGDTMLIDATVEPVTQQAFEVTATAAIEHVGIAAKLRVLFYRSEVAEVADAA
ncbi:MAG TPA: hypothetical protein VGR06_37335 [Actinophytocola sp.]|jgi:3-hydroxyacyl-[acyl-carrier-protein] dehydratase|uniref:hypothetical protein n=1 Tax=Actinophytocola sp. TaxID=1872138 RepID=UPI002DFFB6CD|nr:hypothetical protein [Actinophytocola sp.]